MKGLKLEQSVFLCIADVLRQYLDGKGSLKLGIVKEYVVVYLQMYAKVDI